MKKIFAVLMLATLIFTVGCGNKKSDAAKDTQQKVEQTTNKTNDTNAKVEKKTNTSKSSKSVSKAEINEFANKWLEEVTAMNYRLTDLEKSAGKNGVSKGDMERVASVEKKARL